ncbi:MAG: glycoside hydrolase family 97 catalytic domain-containing protein [Bacteroidaceae bacterium]|nr:glycoside hydrolase family 97 catalytic domain-containing protein [Bacteroidaceae bacterium]
MNTPHKTHQPLCSALLCRNRLAAFTKQATERINQHCPSLTKRGIVRTILLVLVIINSLSLAGKEVGKETITSPDKQITVQLNINGEASYSIMLGDKTMMEKSALGLVTNHGDWSKGLTMKNCTKDVVKSHYTMRTAKASDINYEASRMVCDIQTTDGFTYQIEFRASNTDVAFRYIVPQQKDDIRSLVVTNEKSSFRLPDKTTTFITAQSKEMIGWMNTKPSYEEGYTYDGKLTEKSQYGEGYTFPALFHVGDDGWILISETGVNGTYVGSHLSDWSADGYTIAFPMKGEMNGLGSTKAGLSLPQPTPWRTITVGTTLKPIVETTVSYDLVDEQFAPSEKYKNGRYTWSWLIWQDDFITYDVQKQFIDLSATMGYEYVLVDNWWDTKIGREKIAELSQYAQSKGVHLLLWYNSNGHWNNAPQGPRNCMNSAANRHREMKWMQSIGIKGIKVDFFPGDKQQTMQLYEDILADANEYGLQVVFHGCTIPRGWERMYPNFVASEAVLASENVFFSEDAARKEPSDLCLHPFCRNATASMDWGGVIMNKQLSKDNKGRHKRYTTDLYEMASGIVMQTAVQCVALYPNNLQDVDSEKLEWLKRLPVGWDETRFIDGYPAKYIVIARRHADKWYVAALNGTGETMKLNIPLDMFPTKAPLILSDDTKMNQKVKTDSKGCLKITLQPYGGAVIE